MVRLPKTKKARKSIKLTPGKQRQIESALGLLNTHYGETLAVWSQLTTRQRQAVFDHSPLLARLAALTEPLRENW